MVSILAFRAVQSLVSGISEAEQDEYCSVGYCVLPTAAALFVVSKFWSRSVTQPFQVL